MNSPVRPWVSRTRTQDPFAQWHRERLPTLVSAGRWAGLCDVDAVVLRPGWAEWRVTDGQRRVAALLEVGRLEEGIRRALTVRARQLEVLLGLACGSAPVYVVLHDTRLRAWEVYRIIGPPVRAVLPPVVAGDEVTFARWIAALGNGKAASERMRPASRR